MLIISIVLYVVLVSSGTYQQENVNSPCKVFNNSVNVRTVLFREQDTIRICWSKYDLNLLIARRLVQDLIPRKLPKDFQALLKYFTYLLEEVKAKFPQKNIQIMMLAMYDALGGYLFSVVMPILNEAYYAGNVDYKTVAQLHNMLGVMMDYLATNGRGWAPQCDMSHIATKVAPLPLKMGKIESPCDAFVIPFLSQDKNTGEEENGQVAALTDTKIQIPFLDDNSYPSALAVPLKEHPLFSLMSECAVNIVPKFYILAMRCLSSSPFTKKDVLAFNKNLHRWIITTVVPHLHETNRWYPGFGSVMRVVETMNQRGLASTEKLKPDAPYGHSDTSSDLPPDFICDMGLGGGVPLWEYILLGLLALLLLLVLCCCLHCCVFLVRRRRADVQECDEDEKAVNPLINIYCGLKKKGQRKEEPRSMWSTKSHRSTVKTSRSTKSVKSSHPSKSPTHFMRSLQRSRESSSDGTAESQSFHKEDKIRWAFPKKVFDEQPPKLKRSM